MFGVARGRYALDFGARKSHGRLARSRCPAKFCFCQTTCNGMGLPDVLSPRGADAMLRGGSCVVLFTLTAMPVLAEPLYSASFPPLAREIPQRDNSRAIDLSTPFHGPSGTRIDGDHVAPSSAHQWDSDRSMESHGISVGALRIGSGETIGRHKNLARFTVDGMTILGGSVGGSVDGRSANIVLSWPASS
jgi:hypothetical protein